MRLHTPPGVFGFLDSGGAQIHVPPTREQVLEVPFALAMAQQDEETIGGHGNSLWLEIGERLLKAWSSGGANPKTEARSFGMALSPSAGRQNGFEGRRPRSGDRADADRAMDLLDRLDDVDAREWRTQGRSNPLDRWGGPHHEG